MKPYPTYKDIRAEWLDEIPTHWQINKLARIAEVKGRIGWRGYTVDDLRDEGDGVLVLGATHIHVDGNLDFSSPTYISIEKYEESPEIKLFGNELLMVKVGATIGKVGYVPENLGKATINPNVMIIRNSSAYSRFLFYYLRSLPVQTSMLLAKSAGAQDAINQSFVNSLTIVLPPVPEQQAIADFLDRKIAQIDTLIEKKQRQIDLLQEQRTALINHAVTKGLRPDARMKDSGVEWLGEIPSHWEVKKGRYLFDIVSGFAPSQMTVVENGSCDYIKVDDLNTNDKTLYIHNGKEKFEGSQGFHYEEGIVVFPKRGAAIFTNKVKITKMKCMFDTNLMGLQVFSDIANSEFVAYCLLSRRLDDIADTSTIPQINNKHIYPLEFPFPKLSEQIELVNYIESKTTKIDKSLELVFGEIELLQEYRTALISEAVTGKIDVRTAV